MRKLKTPTHSPDSQVFWGFHRGRSRRRFGLLLIVLIVAALGSHFLFSSRASQSLPTDLNNDGVVNVFDLSIFLSHWQQSGTGLPEDFNTDGLVNIFDLSILLSNYGSTVGTGGGGSGGTTGGPIPAPTANQHNWYLLTDNGYYVYSQESNWGLIDTVKLSLPGGAVRDIIADKNGNMYISYGKTHIKKWNYITKTQIWDHTYSPNTDTGALSPDGSTLYESDGDIGSDPANWFVIRTSDGTLTNTIKASGSGAHNTDISLDGRYVYLGIHNTNHLGIYDTVNHTLSYIGGLTNGVRPMSVTKKYAFICQTDLFGFSTGNLSNNQLLFTSHITGFPTTSPGYVASGSNAPSHGCGVSPDEKELWVMDKVNGMVHVFDVTGLPTTAPKQVKDISLANMDGNESECSYSCFKEGWVTFSRDGNYVVVGDTGKVVDAHTKQVIANLPELNNSRHYIEIDFNNGTPVFAAPTRSGQGFMP